MAVVYLGLGSNLGDRAQHLAQACATLHRHPAITVQAVSSLYHTAPVGVTNQAWFLNAVARLQTALTPLSLLSVTQATERRLGRTPAARWGPRVIDIDLLLYDAVQICRPFLTIPHAALHERAFVLVPLHELAPDLQLPSGAWVRDLLATLPDDGSVQRCGPFPPFVDAGTAESPEST
jgi:2-amino-4-hydroxy-6-hydroxymethyldihydropteridine diphosphokinase